MFTISRRSICRYHYELYYARPPRIGRIATDSVPILRYLKRINVLFVSSLSMHMLAHCCY